MEGGRLIIDHVDGQRQLRLARQFSFNPGGVFLPEAGNDQGSRVISGQKLWKDNRPCMYFGCSLENMLSMKVVLVGQEVSYFRHQWLVAYHPADTAKI